MLDEWEVSSYNDTLSLYKMKNKTRANLLVEDDIHTPHNIGPTHTGGNLHER